MGKTKISSQFGFVSLRRFAKNDAARIDFPSIFPIAADPMGKMKSFFLF